MWGILVTKKTFCFYFTLFFSILVITLFVCSPGQDRLLLAHQHRQKPSPLQTSACVKITES